MAASSIFLLKSVSLAWIIIATKATQKVTCDIKIVSWPLVDGKLIKLFKLIKNRSIAKPKISSGRTNGVEDRKI